MPGTIALASGALRWWVAPLAYVASMAVLMGASGLGLPPEMGQAAIFGGYILLASLIALICTGTNAGRDLGLLTPTPARRVLVISLLGAALAVLMAETAALFDEKIARSSETVLSSIGFGGDIRSDLWIIVTLCCLAPIGEEALYRGLIFRSLFNPLRAVLPSGSGPWGAALIAASLAAIVFAFSHGGEGQETSVIAILFLSGIVYGLCYAVSGALWSAILAHSLNNTAALAMVAFPSDTIAASSKAFLLAAPVLTAVFLWLWTRFFAGLAARG